MLLDSLKRHTIVVADTGDIEAIAPAHAAGCDHQPLAAAEGGPAGAVPAAGGGRAARRPRSGWARAETEAFMDRLAVAFGCEILQIIPGRVSTEVDARLSFDTPAPSPRRGS
jgi:transaldolase